MSEKTAIKTETRGRKKGTTKAVIEARKKAENNNVKPLDLSKISEIKNKIENKNPKENTNSIAAFKQNLLLKTEAKNKVKINYAQLAQSPVPIKKDEWKEADEADFEFLDLIAKGKTVKEAQTEMFESEADFEDDPDFENEIENVEIEEKEKNYSEEKAETIDADFEDDPGKIIDSDGNTIPVLRLTADKIVDLIYNLVSGSIGIFCVATHKVLKEQFKASPNFLNKIMLTLSTVQKYMIFEEDKEKVKEIIYDVCDRFDLLNITNQYVIMIINFLSDANALVKYGLMAAQIISKPLEKARLDKLNQTSEKQNNSKNQKGADEED